MAKLYFKVGSDWEEVVKLRNEIAKLKQELKGIDGTQSPAAFKTLNTQLSASTQRMDELVSSAAKAGAVMENDFKKKIFDSSQSVNGLTEKIIAQKAVVKDVEADVKRLGDAYRIALKRNPLSANSKLEEYSASRKALDEEKAALFGLTQEQANARLSVKKLRDEYALYKDDAKEVVHANDGIGISLKKVFAVIGGAAIGKKLISDIVRVRGEFQAADTAIQTLLGSKEKADTLMVKVKEYAKVSPLEFSDVTAATQMMLGFNVEAEKTPRFIEAIGDISMGEAGKFNSLTLAFSQMSATGKLMGQDLNQMINAGFNPLQQIAETTGKSIAVLKDEMSKGAISAEMVQQAFIDATSAGGKFFGMSENASKTINGQLSMMQDSIDSALNEIGEKSEGVIMGSINMTTKLVENYETVGKVLAGLVATYGTYRTAVMLSTLATGKHTLAEITLTNVRVIARKAQLALNAAMLTNPYVLLATAVVGLGAAMWALRDSTTAVEKGTRRYNEEQEKATKLDSERKQKIDGLIQSSRDIALTDLQRGESLAELRKEYPKIFEKYDIETIKLAEILKLKQQIAEEDAKRAGEEVARNFEAANKAVSDYENALSAKQINGGKLTQQEINKLKELRSYRDQFLVDKGKGISEQFISNLKDVDISEFDRYISDLEKRIKGKGENGTVKIRLPIDLQGTLSDEAIYNVKDIKTLIDTAKSAKQTRIDSEKNKTTYEQDYEKAKKDWDDAKKKLSEIEKDKSKFTSKQYEEAKKRVETTEKAYKDLGGVTESALTKQENQAEKIRKEQEKYNLLLDKQALEQQRSVEDLQMKVDEARIKAMDEGSAKTIAEMELNFEKEMQAIDRQKEDALRKNVEDARAAWEANPKNKGKSFDASGIELSDDERKYYDELYKTAIANNEKTYSELTNQYLSYTDQRLAIEKKFNDDIAVLQESRKKAESKGNTDEVAKIDRSIAKATADKGKELMRHDFDVLKQSPEYIRAFEDLKNTSSETLNSLLEQLENAKQTAAQTLNPEDLREYTTTIQEIMDELDTRNPFQALADRQKELAEAEKELADAKRQLDAVNSGAKIVTGVKSTSLGQDGKIKIENTYLTATEALNKYNAAKDKHQQANNKFIKAEKTAREKVDELADAIKGIGDAIGGQAGEIISLMGDVALFATGTIDGISKVAQTGANAISAVEKASVILGIISTAIQLLQKISELGNNKAFKQYEAYVEKIKEINALTDAVNEYRIAALEARQAEEYWFSEDNLKNLRDYKKVHDEVAKAYADKAMESQAIYKNQSGGGWLTGAFNWVMGNLSALSWWDKWKNIWGQGDYDKGQTAAINNLRIETRKKRSGFLGTGIGGKSQKTEDLVTWARNQGLGELFDDEGLLNKELAQSLIDNYGGKLVGQTKETLESLIKLREQYDEYIEQLHEYVSSLYEPLVDNFVDSLWDWFDNGKDALDSFKDYASDTFRDIVSDMMRTIVLDKVVDNFSDDIASLYEEYAKGSINEAELMKKVAERTSGLVDNYEQNIPTLQNIMEQVNGYLQNAGIDLKQSESTSQSSTSKGFQAMSQDTGEELNGRFTALQIAGEEIKTQNIAQTQSLNLLTARADAILSMNTETRNIADDTRDLIANSYLELVQISENTGNSAKYLKDIKADIAEVKKNTSKL